MRIRDFIKTSEGLYFAVNSYVHPEDRVFAFLRYVPYELGKHYSDEVREIDGEKYVKLSDSKIAYKFLEENFKDYLFYDNYLNVLMHAVPKEKIEKVYYPKRRLEEIIEEPKNRLEEKIRKLALIFEDYGIPMSQMGVTGSTLIRLNNENSDIDFIIYGSKWHRLGREYLKMAVEEGKLESLNLEFWEKAYKKRIKDNTLSFEDFLFHEKRKWNRGVIDNTMFDLLFVREWDEINENYGEKRFKPLGYVKIRARVLDDSFIFDNPALYIVEHEEVREVVSFTHTYAGQCFKGEEMEVRGKLEEVITKEGSYKRVVVGTTREAYNEYIKLIR
ncbi:DNA polymerase beta domain protein region [Methanocaldococcus infernus ME]|uniref:protein adenylyltransferase n=1 Tax=Methanocaldococcus infernus (strain DSM 11812 / JCM 15783 / ME) TaxID=573063 RepID=D5VU88_METIM|nr:nucleotidyltransferase domain-containing protein [Methanocaldococcus infernus]ADG12700.1 DNA polymerase beta domain protein region [Methanocaldococcus infernus ME]